MTNTNLKEFLLENIETTNGIVQELNSWNGCLDHLQVFENDEEFFEMFFTEDKMALVRAISFGEYNYNDEYVRFNGYGNLETLNEYQLEEELKESIEEIIDNLIENQHELSLDSEVEELIEKWDSTSL